MENHEKNNQPNENYSRWQTAMEDVSFQGTNSTPMPNNPESEQSAQQVRICKTIEEIKSKEMEHSGEYLLRPRTEIICDHDHIENQRIDVISKKDKGLLEFKLKLRQPTDTITDIVTRFENADSDSEITTPSGAILKRGEIIYERAGMPSKHETKKETLCDAYVFEKKGVTVSIANPTSINGEKTSPGLIRTAIGLIKIEAPIDMSPEDTERILSEILEKDLGIPSALSEVPKESKEEYKRARFAWQHKISGELTPEQKERAEKLEEKEVFPGYTTYIETGKHKEYLEKYGDDLRIIHTLGQGDAKSIFRILTQGVMSSTERYSRGMIKEGMSTQLDIPAGGADSVFTRVWDKKQREQISETVIVFKPEILDRTDWYSYPIDSFGTTAKSIFSRRLPPEEALDRELFRDSQFPEKNEQMFRTGIGIDYIESIEVSEDRYEATIAELKAMGLETVNGRPIEEIVVAKPQIKKEKPSTDSVSAQPTLPEHTKKSHSSIKKIKSQSSFNPIQKLKSLFSKKPNHLDSNLKAKTF